LRETYTLSERHKLCEPHTVTPTHTDGVSAEIGFYAAEYKGKKPVVGIRSDLRLAENPGAPINPAVRYFMDQGPYGGLFFGGPDAYDEAVESIAKLTETIKESS